MTYGVGWGGGSECGVIYGVGVWGHLWGEDGGRSVDSSMRWGCGATYRVGRRSECGVIHGVGLWGDLWGGGWGVGSSMG